MKASLGKREQKRVKKVLDNLEYYANKIQKMLINKKYIPSPYAIKTIEDGANKKVRTIHKPNFYPEKNG
jgi:RNA-directed DNA polymerase